MNFIAKCCFQWFCSCIPGGQELNYMLQRHFTKSLPVSKKKFLEKAEMARKHYENFKKFSASPAGYVNYYEFGAGWDLISPLVLHSLGVNRLNIIDIKRLIKPELVSDTIEKVYAYKNDIELRPDNLISVLRDKFSIHYEAPKNAKQTGFDDDSMDFIASNVTFEHIPTKDIPAVLDECYRILKPGGIFSLNIDYQDHWSYFDKSISHYNFLKYSEKEWAWLNPPIHYQNRIRHKEFVELLKATKFTILEEINTPSTKEDMETLKSLNISEDLGIKFAEFVLTK
ncbi:MAG: hypothetical protein A2Y25_11915 [Candidatus Melainabacteria bacterium GWF2_37_15]|nr:MAG: hypothetical protein A2Y25_11915 [Candidatus Melainabacteria bacterium GWF2_37_15]